MSTVGEKLRILLRDNQMTQKQLATYMNVSESTVQKWISPTQYHPISVADLKKICSFLI